MWPIVLDPDYHSLGKSVKSFMDYLKGDCIEGYMSTKEVRQMRVTNFSIIKIQIHLHLLICYNKHPNVYQNIN